MALELVYGTEEENTEGNTEELDGKAEEESGDEEEKDEEFVDENEDADPGHMRGEEISWFKQGIPAIEPVEGAFAEQYSFQKGVGIWNF